MKPASAASRSWSSTCRAPQANALKRTIDRLVGGPSQPSSLWGGDAPSLGASLAALFTRLDGSTSADKSRAPAEFFFDLPHLFRGAEKRRNDPHLDATFGIKLRVAAHKSVVASAYALIPHFRARLPAYLLKSSSPSSTSTSGRCSGPFSGALRLPLRGSTLSRCPAGARSSSAIQRSSRSAPSSTKLRAVLMTKARASVEQRLKRRWSKLE